MYRIPPFVGTLAVIIALCLSINALSQNGNVGVGTNTPVEKLDIDGAIKLGNTDSLNAGTIRWTGVRFQG
jgi:hypothetical protein